MKQPEKSGVHVLIIDKKDIRICGIEAFQAEFQQMKSFGVRTKSCIVALLAILLRI